MVHAGGITHLRRIAALADLYQIRTGCHGATEVDAIALGRVFGQAGAEVSLAYVRHTPETDAVFPHAYSFERGMMHPGEKPGLGVELDEVLAAHYPYARAYLPVNRLEDGTMYNW